MRTSEFEYYLLCELITMPDRTLAQKIELHIWAGCPHPDGKVVQLYVDALRESDDGWDFILAARNILVDSGLEFLDGPSLAGGPRRVAPPEVLLADESQEGELTP